MQTVIYCWNWIFAPRAWSPYGVKETGDYEMRRWRDGRWEVRPATDDEARAEAEWKAHR